jgi:hypothetical protein
MGALHGRRCIGESQASQQFHSVVWKYVIHFVPLYVRVQHPKLLREMFACRCCASMMLQPRRSCGKSSKLTYLSEDFLYQARQVRKFEYAILIDNGMILHLLDG